MASWAQFADAEPEFSARVLELFTNYRHHTMATVRRDGSPRISGTEIALEDGQLVLGMMPGTRRAADLRRDPRVAIHSHCVDPVEADPAAWPGEAKVSGRVVSGRGAPGPPAPAEPTDADWFRVDLCAVVITRLSEAADQLVIESWTPERGYREERR
ncbi:MAG TPA: pyridoxamine 5'-phosphate oxidase family protein [Acidimicrobiales bacterium]|nr:pyridoxamine 5'-phosphate oxidase family protein [Acidimicrobiales bacterium]